MAFLTEAGAISALPSMSTGMVYDCSARSNDEVWVVNHVSDSVSIINVAQPHRPEVVRTLLVGDELTSLNRKEVDMWTRVVKQANIKKP